MTNNKQLLTTLVGIFVVALLVVSIAGCTSAPSASPSPTAAQSAATATPMVSTQAKVSQTSTPTRTPASTSTSKPTAQLSQATSTRSSASYTGPFYASRNSNVYHYPWCYHVNAILPKNLISFPTAAAAQAAGYRPCKDCNPPT